MGWRSRRAARATPAGSVCTAGGGACSPRAPGAFFFPRDVRTARPDPAPASQVLGFPSPQSLPAPPARAGPASPGWDGGGRGVGWRWGAGSLVLLSGALGRRGRVDEALGWALETGKSAESDLGLCTLGELHGHRRGRDPEPPVYGSPSSCALRCVQLPPELGLYQPPAIRIYFANVRFFVLTIILLSPCNSCVNLVKLRRCHYVLLKRPFPAPNIIRRGDSDSAWKKCVKREWPSRN